VNILPDAVKAALLPIVKPGTAHALRAYEANAHTAWSGVLHLSAYGTQYPIRESIYRQCIASIYLARFGYESDLNLNGSESGRTSESLCHRTSPRPDSVVFGPFPFLSSHCTARPDSVPWSPSHVVEIRLLVGMKTVSSSAGFSEQSLILNVEDPNPAHGLPSISG